MKSECSMTNNQYPTSKEKGKGKGFEKKTAPPPFRGRVIWYMYLKILMNSI